MGGGRSQWKGGVDEEERSQWEKGGVNGREELMKERRVNERREESMGGRSQ